MNPDSQIGVLIVAAYVPILLAVAWLAINALRKRKPGEPVIEQPVVEVANPAAIAERLGATLEDDGYARKTLSGERNGRPYELRCSVYEGTWYAEVRVPLQLDEELKIKEEGFFSAEDPEVGLPGFDDVVHLDGDPAWLSAALVPEACRLIIDLQSRGGYKLSRVGIFAGVTLANGGDDVGHRVEAMTRLGVLLDLPADAVPERLFERAREEGRAAELAGWRLLAHFPDHARAQELAGCTEGALAAVVRGEDVEASLIDELAHRDLQRRLAVVELLRQKGTVHAVQALRSAATGSLKTRARAAVAAIQGRAGDVGPGGLAVVPDEQRGELSVAQGGGLAVVPPKERA